MKLSSAQKVLLIFLLAWSQLLSAQNGSLDYKDRGNRYEGRVTIKRAKEQLTILSFTLYVRPFKPGDNVDWSVSFYAPLETNAAITAEDLDGEQQYRMESKSGYRSSLGWNHFSPWPTHDALVPLGLSADDVGIVVALTPSTPHPPSDIYLVPAIVGGTKDALASTITLILRPEYTQSQFRYEVWNGSKLFLNITPSILPVAGREYPITIDRQKLPVGPLDIKLTGQNRNREGGISYKISFYNPPLS
jgi:hypothetical protein